jgi:hypothetical protein
MAWFSYRLPLNRHPGTGREPDWSRRSDPALMPVGVLNCFGPAVKIWILKYGTYQDQMPQIMREAAAEPSFITGASPITAPAAASSNGLSAACSPPARFAKIPCHSPVHVERPLQKGMTHDQYTPQD